MEQYAEQDIFSHMSLDPQEVPMLPAQRRQHPSVVEMVHMIGTSLELYDATLRHLRVRFLKTKNWAYCALRADVIMALHDADAASVYRCAFIGSFVFILADTIRATSLHGVFPRVCVIVPLIRSVRRRCMPL